MKTLDLYINEINNSELKKIIKSNDVMKIIEVIKISDEDDIKLILKSVNGDIRKQLETFIEGGLI